MSPLDLSLERFEARLSAHRAREHSRLVAPTRAAVAALLRFEGRAPSALLMRRAEHPGDRWSGHVSFPGGREEEHDEDLLSTAVRETAEEIGVDLRASARLLGRIDSVRAVARGKLLPMSITPFVFVQTDEIDPVLSDEAVETFWLPLDRVACGELDSEYPYRKGPVRWNLPCWRYEGRVVWGLTYEMLSRLLSLLE